MINVASFPTFLVMASLISLTCGDQRPDRGALLSHSHKPQVDSIKKDHWQSGCNLWWCTNKHKVSSIVRSKLCNRASYVWFVCLCIHESLKLVSDYWGCKVSGHNGDSHILLYLYKSTLVLSLNKNIFFSYHFVFPPSILFQWIC